MHDFWLRGGSVENTDKNEQLITKLGAGKDSAVLANSENLSVHYRTVLGPSGGPQSNIDSIRSW